MYGYEIAGCFFEGTSVWIDESCSADVRTEEGKKSCLNKKKKKKESTNNFCRFCRVFILYFSINGSVKSHFLFEKIDGKLRSSQVIN